MNNKGISLIALIVTIIVIMILAAIVVSTGFDTADSLTSEELCIMRNGEHQYITVSKYDTLNKQYYNVAVCSRCGHELNTKGLGK